MRIPWIVTLALAACGDIVHTEHVQEAPSHGAPAKPVPRATPVAPVIPVAPAPRPAVVTPPAPVAPPAAAPPDAPTGPIGFSCGPRDLNNVYYVDEIDVSKLTWERDPSEDTMDETAEP